MVELTRLRPLADLVKLSVEGNPLTNPTHSRQFIIFQLRSLEVLDGKVVTEEDREAADVRFGQGKLVLFKRYVTENVLKLSFFTQNTQGFGVKTVSKISHRTNMYHLVS